MQHQNQRIKSEKLPTHIPAPKAPRPRPARGGAAGAPPPGASQPGGGAEVPASDGRDAGRVGALRRARHAASAGGDGERHRDAGRQVELAADHQDGHADGDRGDAARNDLERALSHHQQGLAIRETLPDRSAIAIGQRSVAAIYLAMGRIEEALAR